MRFDRDHPGTGRKNEFAGGDFEVTERVFGLIWRVAVIGLLLVVLTPAARLGG